MFKDDKERTFVMLKPDAMKKAIIGKVIERIEEAGCAIGAAACRALTVAECQKLYAHTRQSLPVIYGMVERHMTESPSLLLVITGENALDKMRALRGPTDLAAAPPGTVRRDFIDEATRELFTQGIYTGNVMHASGSRTEAAFEIDLLMGDGRGE